jgi:hypothetical protein
MKGWYAVFLLTVTLTSLISAPVVRPVQADAWADAALIKEANYIVDCSFTEYARNGGQAQPSADAYGALNVLRIYQKGPDWVRPGEASMGAIGLMAGAIQLKAEGQDITPYDQVLDRFFHTWVVARSQPFNTDPGSANYGGVFERIYYDSTGTRLRTDPPNAGVTGQLIAAMWKYYEYNVAIGKTQAANDWLQQGWPMARLAGYFIQQNYNGTYNLVQSNASATDLWVSDGSYAAMALRCLDEWSRSVEKDQVSSYAGLADAITTGLQGLKDDVVYKNFHRYRLGSTHAAMYGDRIDQLCFLPYEADVLDPGEPFAGSISDWWTYGSDGSNGSQKFSMTDQTADTSDWRYFGTHLRHFLNGGGGSQEGDYLYAGAALQLAKVEWKHASRTGDTTIMERARKRFEWVRSTGYSDLWMGANGNTEAGVSNGLVDWRDTKDYTHNAGDWARFVDTSGYFIEVVLMLYDNVDTKYVPN